MSHIHQGPLATYNSLADGHLSGYFSNHRMRRHLRKAGLVSKQGDIVSESTYRLNMTRKEHKKQVKDMLAQAIVHKTLDLERTRQAEIKKKLEEISKIQLVRRVRGSTGRKGDEEILPYLTPRSWRPGSSPAFKPKGHTTQSKLRPNSAPGVRSESRHSQISVEEEGDVLYLDDDGRPITPANQEPHGEQSHIDSRHLHTLDTAAIRKYAMLMSQMEEGRGVTSPYMMSQVPLPPKARLSRPVLSSRRVQSASPKRPITTDTRIARLHRPETAKAHPGDMQMMCRVLMKYHGWALNLAREKMDPTQEVVVEQQHCGGNTLTVFKERLTPGSTFEFISYRHRGYPFSLTLYLDGQMDSRVSTCCEYRHSRGAKIGGKQGHFSLLSVDGAVPCYKCQVAKGVLVRNKATPRKAKRPSERHMEEVIVVATKKDDDEDDLDTERSTKHAKPVGEDEGAVLIPVERDEEENEDKTPQSPAERDTTYDDDFDDDKSSASSRTSSASESETESSSRKDEGVQRGQRAREHFRPSEARGEDSEGVSPTPLPAVKEEEEEEERERGGGDSWTRRVKVNGTGREIDDYSSDNDDDDQKVKVINMENIEADNQRMTHQRSRASSSSSYSSSTAANTKNMPPEEERGTDNAVISVDLVDREERDEENVGKERQKREEEQRREEEEFLQQQRRKKEERRESVRRTSEVRRQEEAYEKQFLEARRQKKEGQRRREEEKEHFESLQQVEEERRRSVIMVLEEPDTNYNNAEHRNDARHDEKFDAAKSEDTESITEDSPRVLEKAEKNYDDDEEDSERPKEEKTYSSRTESSSARSSRSASSPESTPRQPPTTEPTAQEDGDAEPMRLASPPPSDAVMTHLGQKQDDTAPPRAPSPFPCPAVYLHRRETRDKLDEALPPRSESPPASRPLSPVPPTSQSTTLSPVAVSSDSPAPSEQPPRATSPFPTAAVYMDRPKRRKEPEPGDTAGSTEVDTSHSLASSTASLTSHPEDGLDTRDATGIKDRAVAEKGEAREEEEAPVRA